MTPRTHPSTDPLPHRAAPRALPATALALALLSAGGSLCAGCGAPEARTMVVITDRQASPRMDFEELRLLMTPAQALKRAVAAGWKHGISPEVTPTQVATAEPRGGDVARYEMKFEDGHLISLTIHYRVADPRRAEIRAHYATKRKGLDGTWAMTDASRQTVVTVSRDGGRLVAVHTGKARDRGDVQAMFELLFHEKPGARAPASDPVVGGG